MLQAIEIAAVMFAIAYLALAIRQSLWCWPAALVSVTLFMLLFLDARWYMQSLLQGYYFAMAIYGWVEWKRGGDQGTGVVVHWWSALSHVAAIALIVVASIVFGKIMTRTDAAFPFLDSFSTIGALVTTFMVTRKVIENWLYWFVIDLVLVYMSWQSDLPWTAGLYVLYLVMVVIGFRSWLKNSRAEALEGYGQRSA